MVTYSGTPGICKTMATARFEGFQADRQSSPSKVGSPRPSPEPQIPRIPAATVASRCQCRQLAARIFQRKCEIAKSVESQGFGRISVDLDGFGRHPPNGFWVIWVYLVGDPPQNGCFSFWWPFEITKSPPNTHAPWPGWSVLSRDL